MFDILVNGDDHEIDTKEIAYVRVVDLYLGSGGKPSNEYLVKYSHGLVENSSGTLAPGSESGGERWHAISGCRNW